MPITKKCKITNQDFTIENEDIDFYVKVGVLTKEEGEKAKQGKNVVGLPTLCPEERARRRFCFRNIRKLYKAKCDYTGEDIISMHDPITSPFPIYKNNIWAGDKWDPKEYEKDFDFNKPFFEQFLELQNAIPHQALSITEEKENSDYCNGVDQIKDSYLCFNMMFSEKCLYSNNGTGHNSSSDLLSSEKCELSCEIINSSNLYNCQYILDSQNCNMLQTLLYLLTLVEDLLNLYFTMEMKRSLKVSL